MTRDSGDGLQISIHVDESEEPPHSGSLLPDSIRRLTHAVLEAEGVTDAEVSIVFCGDERIAGLNTEWIGHEGPTDVISFPLNEGSEAPDGPLEGEIYIDLAQAIRQAPEFEASPDEEIRRLVIHGVLHLVGYDDADVEDAEEMLARQEEQLAAFPDPVLAGAS